MVSRVKSSDVSSKSRSTISLTFVQCLGLIAGFFRLVINGRVRLNLSTLPLKNLLFHTFCYQSKNRRSSKFYIINENVILRKAENDRIEQDNFYYCLECSTISHFFSLSSLLRRFSFLKRIFAVFSISSISIFQKFCVLYFSQASFHSLVISHTNWMAFMSY